MWHQDIRVAKTNGVAEPVRTISHLAQPGPGHSNHTHVCSQASQWITGAMIGRYFVITTLPNCTIGGGGVTLSVTVQF